MATKRYCNLTGVEIPVNSPIDISPQTYQTLHPLMAFDFSPVIQWMANGDSSIDPELAIVHMSSTHLGHKPHEQGALSFFEISFQVAAEKIPAADREPLEEDASEEDRAVATKAFEDAIAAKTKIFEERFENMPEHIKENSIFKVQPMAGNLMSISFNVSILKKQD